MKSAKIKLPFGLNESNVLVHISQAERGKKCYCVCPSCRSPLIAAKGNKKQPHFKHDMGDECERGLESAIHLAAKQILMERKRLTLPVCIAKVSERDSRGFEHTEQETVVRDGTVMPFDSVQNEVGLNGMKVDILATKGDAKLIIEIYYRHKVEEQKLVQIAKSGISAIEIDLSDLTHEDVKDWDAFWSCINDSRRVQWLYNHKAHHTVYLKLEKQLAEKIQVQKKLYEEEAARKRVQEINEQAGLLRALNDLKNLRSEEHIAQLQRQAQAHPAWVKHSKFLPFSWHELPHFIDVEVADGNWIYGCDRRIWQAAFYRIFICKIGKPFSIQRVEEWLQNNAECKVPHSAKTVGIYGRRYPQLLPPEIATNLPSSWRALKEYFWHLCDLGMLEYSGDDWKHPGSSWFKVISKNAERKPAKNESTDFKIYKLKPFERLPADSHLAPESYRNNLLIVTERMEWKEKAKEYLNQSSFDEKFVEEFRTHWSEAGHQIRMQIKDDRILVDLLTHILPKYQGPAIKLYRGENWDRFYENRIGLCWTSQIETARMFGRGLNSVRSGGVLLEAECSAEIVIAGPSKHSVHLGENEYTVNPIKLSMMRILENFPASH